MNRRLLIVALLATTAYAAESPRLTNPPTAFAPLPQGWGLMGGGGPHQVPGTCEVGLETDTSADGPQLFSVRCTNETVPSFGGGWRSFEADRYQGKRVRVSGWLKVTGVERVVNTRYPAAPGEAGLYLGVGSPSGVFRQDRMPQRAIKGSTAWEYRDFVVDVPRDSKRLLIGFWMEGRGQVWVRDLQVEKVSKKVPVNFLQEDGPGFGLTLK
jgi:hypothetical protein